MTPDSTNSAHVEKLALKLALNSINVSAGEFQGTSSFNRSDVYQKVFDTHVYEKIESPNDIYRCIVVVGAGASYNASQKLILGRNFTKALKLEFKEFLSAKVNDEEKKDDLLETELNRLKRIYKLDSEEFETVLYAISKYYPKWLLGKLKKRYGHRYNPSLPYEILAHLMKHRFVDAIINFNFDELLDQSIEDELKSDAYHKILFDGDVAVEDIFIPTEGLRHPLYIKPHGTISHESSLRFTEEAYYGIPKNIENILEKLLSAKIKVNDEEKQMKVILVAIGYNMQSTEFNVLLNQCLPKDSEIYLIKPGPEKPEIDLRPLDLNGLDKPHLKTLVDEATVITIDNHLDETIEGLWDKVKKNFIEGFMPRGIERHQLISKLFNENDTLRNETEIADYFWRRTYVEFVLSVAKYKGFVCANQLSDDRFGKYFQLALKNTNKSSLGKTVYSCNLLQVIEKFGFIDAGYGGKAFINNEILQQREKLKDKNIEQKWPLTITGPEFFNKLLPDIQHVLLSMNIDKLIKEETETLFKRTLKALFQAEDTEISPKFNNIFGQVFTSPKVMKTKLGLDLNTQQYIELHWDVMYAVAETGEWLLNTIRQNKDSFKGKEIILIYADESTSHLDLVNHSKEIGVKFESCYLPWWQHNQHLTIFLKRHTPDSKKLSVLRGIYFTRGLRASHICPVLIEGWDCRLLVETFEAYRQKSKNFNAGPGQVVTKKEINNALEKYSF